MSAARWPKMNYYQWLEWCEAHSDGRDGHDVRVFVGPHPGTEWMLTERRWDGQPPLDAWVRVPLWALAQMTCRESRRVAESR